MPILKTLNLTDEELFRERQIVLNNLYEMKKLEVETLKAQVALLTTTNNELSAYAATFKLDEVVEEKNIEAAKEATVESDDDFMLMNQVSELDNEDIGKEIIDLDTDNTDNL